MPNEGRFELYPFFRKMIHKFGFRCWAGEEAANEYLVKVRFFFFSFRLCLLNVRTTIDFIRCRHSLEH